MLTSPYSNDIYLLDSAASVDINVSENKIIADGFYIACCKSFSNKADYIILKYFHQNDYS